MADALQIRLDVETRQAVTALASVTKGLKDTEEGAKKTESAFGRFSDAQRSLSDTAERYHANLSRAVGLLSDFAQATMQGAAANEQHERALRLLGGAYDTVAVQTRGAVTAEQALRTQQSLAQSGLRMTTEQLGVVTRAAREYALATGTETTQALDQLTDALRGGEAEGLRRFGIALQQGQSRASAFETSLRRLGDQQRAMAPAAQTMAEANEQLTQSWSGLANTLFADLARWADLQGYVTGLAQGIRELTAAHGNLHAVLTGNTQEDVQRRANDTERNRELDLRQEYTQLTEQLRTRLPAGQAESLSFGRARNLNAAQLSDRVARMRAILARSASVVDARGTGNTLAFARGDGEVAPSRVGALLTADPTATAEEIAALARDTQQTETENLGARARLASARDARIQREEQERLRANRTPGGGGSAAQYSASRFDLADQINSLFTLLRDAGLGSPTRARASYASSERELADLLSTITGQASGAGYRTLERRPGEDLATFLGRSSQGANDFLTSRRDALDAERQAIRDKQASQREIENELEQERLQRERSKGDAQTELDRAAASRDRTQLFRSDVGAQFSSQFVPAADATKTAAEQMAEGVKGAFDTMTGAIKSHVAAVIEGRESIGEALRAIAHETLLSLAQEAIGRSLMETAAGIAALTNPITAATAPGHFAAAGVYAAVAGLAGIGAYATNAPAAAAATAPGGRVAPAASAGSLAGGSSSGAQSITINVNGTVMDREGTANAILGAVNDAIERGGMLRAA